MLGQLPRRFTARAASLDELLQCSPHLNVASLDRGKAVRDLARFFTADDQPVFKEFLKLRGINEDDVLTALSIEFMDPTTLAKSPWYRLLVDALSSQSLSTADREIIGTKGLRAPLYPFLNWAGIHLRQWSKTYDANWDSLRASLLELLSDQLAQLTYKAFTLEARIMTFRADTEDPDRHSAIKLFARSAQTNIRYVQRLWLSYPALARLCATVTLQWQQNMDEMLLRLFIDRNKIESCILRKSAGVLDKIEDTRSDPHNGGKRVLILHFSQGEKLVYKPRSVNVDLSYQQLVAWLNNAGLSPQLRVLNVVPGEDYGWIEFVESQPLASQDALHRFYARHGIQLAILYSLKGTDFHSENVIASGEHPVLVDLETLMHGNIRLGSESNRTNYGEVVLQDSVFGSGLLPGWTDGAPFITEPDLSGIGTREGQIHRYMNDFIESNDDGSIRVLRKKATVSGHTNRPFFADAAVNPAPFHTDVIEGFNNCVAMLQANAAALALPDGPLAGFMRAKVRHVALSTSVYSGLLRRATHPDFLRRSSYRELVFAQLAQRSRVHPSSSRLLNSELISLFDGDIPKFVVHANSSSLFDSEGRELPGVLEDCPTNWIPRRAALLTEENIKLQKRIIRLSMATLRKRGETGTELAPQDAVPTNALREDEILYEVRRLADTLCNEAVFDDQSIDWVGLTQVDYGRSKISAAGVDLYEGVSGIGLFLAHAGIRLKDDRLISFAKRCGLVALEALHHEPRFVGGAYNGLGSIAYGLLHMGASLREDAWLDVLFDKLICLNGVAAKDTILDIIAGSAGMCGVLVAAHKHRPDKRLLDCAIRFAEHLIKNRENCGPGYGWPSRNSRAPLTGFSHGAAGIGWALIQVGYLTNREDLIEAGKRAFAYERSVYCERESAWPDFRNPVVEEEASTGYALAWCHGSPGIGLSRASLPTSCIDQDDLNDIAIALRTVEKPFLSPSDCLCHGELGNVELLLTAAGPTNQPDLLRIAKLHASGAIARRQKIGRWRCGTVPDEDAPGLLVGLAGIGYGLLRSYFPDNTPSALALDPPRQI